MVRGSKNLKLSPDTAIDGNFRKKIISKFTVVLFCLLLSCCQLYQVNQNSKFGGP